eukprot:scaffold4661_cov108-Cylindrotheca_fusiformis.AAC.6
MFVDGIVERALNFGSQTLMDDAYVGIEKALHVSNNKNNMGISKGMAVIQEELQGIAVCHNWPCPERKDNQLQPRHLEEFHGTTLFDQFARVVCKTDCIVRKEVFETWAMALHVHDHFPESTRFTDIAAGHGLLSWALLLLNEERTAICIDRRMPKTADKLRKGFLRKWPNLEDRWDYVEGKLEFIEPAPSTLLVGVHCCGPLSDKIVDLAILGNSPLALVPCCHTVRQLTKEQRQDIRNECYTLADFVDSLRIQRLRDANFDVIEGSIPKEFTPKNRIILGTPPHKDHHPTVQTPVDNDTIAQLARGVPEFTIPVGDTPEAKASVRSIAGRDAANLRKGHSRSLCLSLFQPPGPEPLTPDQIAVVANTLREDVAAWSSFVDKEGFLYKDGRICRTYRLIYRTKGEDVMTKEHAKEVHIELCHRIPVVFPGAEVRQIPR